MTHEGQTTTDVVISGTLGFLLSIGGAEVMPELIHGAAVFFTGLLTATGVFFIQRFLRKKFPDAKN
jgi:hypothetical protein